MNQQERAKYWEQVEGGKSSDVAESMRLLTGLAEPELVARAIARYDTGDWRGALQDANVVLDMNADNLVMRAWRGLSLAKLNRFGEVYPELVTAPFFPHYRILFEYLRVFWPLQFQDDGPGNRDQESPDTAKDPLDADFQEFQNSGKAKNASLRKKYEKQAYRFYGKKDFLLAYHSCLRAADCAPEHPTSMEFRIRGLIGLGRAEEAAQTLGDDVRKRLQAYQDKGKDTEQLPSAELACLWAMLLHQCGDYEGSLAILGELAPSGPYDFGMHFIAGVNWIMLNDREKAWQCLEVAFRDFYFETWPLYLEQFKGDVDQWLEVKHKES